MGVIRNTILFSIYLLFTLNANSQNLEFGIYLGGSNFIGDVSEQKLNLSQTHPSFGIIGRFNASPKVALKGYFGYGRLSGADSLASSSDTKNRNLNFYTDIFEFSAHVEYNLVRNSSVGFSNSRPWIPYLFAGIGIFKFNPQTKFQGNVYELQPLGTEGQGTTQYNDRKKYALTEICIPLGIGIKKKLSNRVSIGLEVGVRFTTTNYIDDVGGKYANPLTVARSNGDIAAALSNRTGEVNPDKIAVEGDDRTTKPAVIKNDMYIIGGISIAYIFRNQGITCPRF